MENDLGLRAAGEQTVVRTQKERNLLPGGLSAFGKKRRKKKKEENGIEKETLVNAFAANGILNAVLLRI